MPSDPLDESHPSACVTCATVLQGPYCHRCGERVLDASDLRLFVMSSETPVTVLVLGILSTYLAMSLRTVHGTAPVVAAVKGLTGVVLLAPVITVYRALLFFVVHVAVTGDWPG